MFRTDLFYKRIENCATLHRNVGPQFSRTRLLVSFHNSSRLSSQLLVNSANLKLMLIESVSSSINRIDYSRKLIGKVKVNAKISDGKIYGNAFDFNLDRKIFSLDLFG